MAGEHGLGHQDGSITRCPVCQVAPAAGATTCPDCGEDLRALIYLRYRSKILLAEGLQLAEAGDLESAISLVVQAVGADSEDVAALMVLGKLYIQIGRHIEAKKAWAKVLSQYPRHAGAIAAIRKLDELEAAAETHQQEQAEAAELARARAARSARAATLIWIVGAFAVGVLILGAGQILWTDLINTSSGSLNNSTVEEFRPTASVSATAESPASASPAPTPIASVVPDLRAAVENALHARTELGGLSIQVIQLDTAIRLAGEVPTVFARYAAESSARTVPGVTVVDLASLSLPQSYVVQPGDSLWDIALKIYGWPDAWRALASINDISPPYGLAIGETLLLPKE